MAYTWLPVAMRVKVKQALVLAFAFAANAQLQGACTPPADLARALHATPDAATHARLGSWYADHQQFQCAADAFRNAAALDPASARYEYLLGLSLSSYGQFADAVGPLRRAVRLDPGAAVEKHLLLGTALDATGSRASAEMEWRLALASDTKSVLALESLSRDLLADHNDNSVISLLQPIATSGTLTDPMAINLAAAYSKSGLTERAVSLLQKKLQDNAASLPLAEALSGVLMLESRFQDAVAVLGAVAREHPQDVQAQVLLLQALVLAHDPGAEAFGQKLLAAEPRQWELLYFMGMLHQRDNDYAAARGYLERSIAAKPANPDAHYRLGMVLSAMKEEPAARKELEKSLALGLDSPEVHFALAKSLRASGDAAAATQQLKLYQQKLNIQAARAQAADKAQQGDQAEAAGNTQQTVADYREALALDPQEPVLAYKLGMALDKTGDKAAERVALEQAIALDPYMAVAQNQLGYLDAADEKVGDAVQHFQCAVDADPAFSKAWMNLAASLALQSKWTEAREALRHVTSLGGDEASANALLQQINAMEAQTPR